MQKTGAEQERRDKKAADSKGQGREKEGKTVGKWETKLRLITSNLHENEK